MDLRERRFSEHISCPLIQCPSLLLAVSIVDDADDAAAAGFFATLCYCFPFQVRCKLLNVVLTVGFTFFLRPTREGYIFPGFEHTAINSLSNGYFVATH